MNKHIYVLIFLIILFQNKVVVAQAPSGTGITYYGTGALGDGKPSSSTGNYNSVFGYQSLYSNSTGTYNSSVGAQSLFSNLTGSNNVAFGHYSLYSNTSGSMNSAIGARTMQYNTSGSFNTAFGRYSLSNNISGSYNIAMGQTSLGGNIDGNYNTAIGFWSMQGSQGSNSENTAVGSESMKNVNTQKSIGIGVRAGLIMASELNTFIGYESGLNNVGGSNVFIVANSGKDINAGSGNTTIGTNSLLGINDVNNASALGYNSRVDCSDCLVLGSVYGENNATSSVRVGIGNTNPEVSSILELKSSSKGLLIPRMTYTEKNSISNPANGLLIYQTDGFQGFYYYNGTKWTGLMNSTTATGGWNLEGNAGTNPSTNFIGTIDNQDLVFRVNNTESGRLSALLSNTSFGVGSLVSNTTGNANTVIGAGSLSSNTTGYQNTAIGFQSMGKNIDGRENTAVGFYSLLANTSGILNTTLGFASLMSNTIGNANVAIGGYTLQANETGGGNIAIGNAALRSNSTAGYNIAIGVNALYSNLTAEKNVAIGFNAMQYNTTGADNIAMGYHSLHLNTTGYNNTIIGSEALFNNTTGTNNTAFGRSSLISNTTGISNTALGAFSNLGSPNLSNATAIGANARVDCNDCIVLGSVIGENSASQTVRVGIGNTNPDASSILDLKSSTKGILIPRLTLAQKSTISSPSVGLLVFQTDGITGFYYYNGTKWVGLMNSSVASSGWNLDGNTGTDSKTNFIGTTDNQDLVIKINNTESGRLSMSSTNSSWGYSSLLKNITGSSNTSIGNGTMVENTTGYDNTAVGSGAMEKNTVGYANSTLGVLSLHYNNTGIGNNSFGYQSLHSNITGSGNTAMGLYSLHNNQTGQENVAIGNYALASNVSANSNVAVGTNALSSSDVADKNSALGYNSMQKTTSGIHNTAMGYYSLVLNTTGSNNSILGSEAMYFNTTGLNNTALGKSALVANTTGNNNTAVGAFANAGSDILNNTTSIGAYSKVDCSGCLVLGSVSGQNNATETVRTGIGTTNPNSKAALDIVSTNRGLLIPRMTSAQKTAISPGSTETGLLIYQTDGTTPGFQYFNGTAWTSFAATGTSSGWALNGNSGTDATTNFIGTIDNKDLVFKVNNINAGRLSNSTNNTSLGYNSQIANTTGAFNTAIGVNSLGLNKTGSNNTAIGYNTVIGTSTSSAFSNSTAIGNGAVVNASNKIVIGNTAVTSIGGQASWTKFSDGRYKQNIKEDVPGIQFIKSLRPVTYFVDYNNLDAKLNQQSGTNHKQIKETGFIAQEVEKAAKKIGYEFSGVDKPENDQESFYGLRYEEFVVPLVKAVQELSAENEVLKERLSKIESLLMGSCQNQNPKSTAIPVTIVSLSSAKIEQNVPNPFSFTTTVNYYIPEQSQKAYLLIKGPKGEMIRNIALNSFGAGKLVLDTKNLNQGLYYYSLLIDGEIIDTKKMVLNR